jgi:hypothetical protein
MAVAMYVFSRKSLYKTESAIFQLQFYHVKDYFFLRYQRGNHNPYIEEEQTTQWPKEKVQKCVLLL